MLTVRRELKKLEVGSEVWINAINLSLSGIEELRRWIVEGCLIPVEEQLQACIVEDYWNDYRSGESIAPQMLYKKVKEME